MTRLLATVVTAGICLLAFVFGLIRIGVSGLLMLQVLGAYDIAAFSGPIAEIQHFLSAENARALVPLAPLAYLAIIALMGLCLVSGALLSWRRRILGYVLLSTYLLAHAGLFVNFQTINPKIYILVGGVILLGVLLVSNRHRPA